MHHPKRVRTTGLQGITAFVEFVLSRLTVKTNISSRQHGEHGYTLNRRVVDDYNLIFVTRGRVVWVIDDIVHEMNPGAMVIVPPGVAHHAFSRTRRYTLGSLHVEATLPSGQDAFALLRPPRALRFEPGKPLDRYLRGALAEFERASTSDIHLMLRSWARLVTIELLRQCLARGQLQPQPIDPIVTGLLGRLAARSGQRMSLPALAALAGYSPQHINRRFRKALGVTPRQYLTRLRIESAATTLVETSLSVKEVASAAGFDDPYYFSRAFKQHLGSSPARFRDAAGSFSPSPRSAPPLR